MTVLAFGVGGLSLMGLPPSGGFMAKCLLLTAAIDTGQWWWALVILAGGLLTGGYLYRVLGPGREQPEHGAPLPAARPWRAAERRSCWRWRWSRWSLGLLPLASFGLLQIGRFDWASP